MNKTKIMMTGITATALTLAGCSTTDEENTQSSPPSNQHCKDWDWDEETQVWVCDERRSSYFGHYFLANQFFQNKKALQSSNVYQDHTRKATSGFGSGIKSTGG
ncbi:hypothetical protein GCM10007425_01600 [Lysinibacillus alkalisoli]|uniref:Lipoprotein n=1 Tax=Lysinibacillus alkalisoli TaxID=1911548 RepID=A0A917D6P6_9BACI|nr:aminotransferase yhxA [Lysinibacillus alkalisoli]GGG10966.1 hypothetical protein GCM10007425_01600 [Lysinibacillus alkalisoli]